MKHSLIALAVLAMSSSAFALGDATYNSGGSAIAAPVSNATGGSVLGSGNSANANTNTNVLGQQQGQGQAQGQTAIGVGLGGGGGSASATSGSSSTSGATSNSGGNTMVGGRQDTTNNNGSAANVTVEGDQAQARNPASTAYAPSIAPTALCALSVSGGLQLPNFGLAGGKAYIDDNCQLLEQVRAVAGTLGDRVTAAEMLCEVPAYKAARARTGKPCGGTPATKSATIGGGSSDAPAASGYTGNDPYILKRLAR